MVVCKQCSSEFSSTDWRQKYCTPTCKRSARNHQAKMRRRNKEFSEGERERLRLYAKEWRKKNPNYEKERYKVDEKFRNTKRCRSREYRRRNLEARRAYCRAWTKTNPEKVAALNAKKRDREYIDHEIVKRVFKRCHGQCVYCGSTEDKTLEHLIPLSRGGTNEESNLAVACSACNCMKGNKTPDEFEAYLEEI